RLPAAALPRAVRPVARGRRVGPRFRRDAIGRTQQRPDPAASHLDLYGPACAYAWRRIAARLPARDASQARARAGRGVTESSSSAALCPPGLRDAPQWARVVSNLGRLFLSSVSGINLQVSTSPMLPMQAKPKKALLLPSRSLIHPASVVLNAAPIPTALPTMPWARLKRPVPRVISAMVRGTSTPNTAAQTPSRSCTATRRRGSATTMNRTARTGKAANPISNTGRRPHRCAKRPTEGENTATTSCGTTMQAATSADRSEARVAAEPFAAGGMTDEPKADGGKRGAHDGAPGGLQKLRAEHGWKDGPYCDDQRARADKDHRKRRDRAPRARGVHDRYPAHWQRWRDQPAPAHD